MGPGLWVWMVYVEIVRVLMPHLLVINTHIYVCVDQVHSCGAVVLHPTRGGALSPWQREGGVVWIPSEYPSLPVEDDAQH